MYCTTVVFFLKADRKCTFDLFLAHPYHHEPQLNLSVAVNEMLNGLGLMRSACNCLLDFGW